MKDVREYLHLYLPFKAYIFPVETISNGWLSGMLRNHDSLEYEILIDLLNFNQKIIKYGYTPILSRLSDMTEEDKLEIFEVGESTWRQRHRKFKSDQTVKLLSKGYWLFGDSYFDKGLIIDKKTLQV